jgi:hypothetical protein
VSEGTMTHSTPSLTPSHFSDLAMEWRDLLLGVDLDFVKSRKAYVQVCCRVWAGCSLARLCMVRSFLW